jgi:hypothetical protein
MLAGKKSAKDYPGKIRKIKYADPETGKLFVFLTNIFCSLLRP